MAAEVAHVRLYKAVFRCTLVQYINSLELKGQSPVLEE